MLTRNSCLSKLERGSAAYVVAHARWRRSRGRGPSTPYLIERNPRKALAIAQVVLDTISLRQRLDEAPYMVSSALQLATMDESEIVLHVRRIVVECTSEDELYQRLVDELGLSDFCINWSVPSDILGVEARDIVLALGAGLVSKNGAMVSLAIYNSPSGDAIIM